jgi:hypothetical protein
LHSDVVEEISLPWASIRLMVGVSRRPTVPSTYTSPFVPGTIAVAPPPGPKSVNRRSAGSTAADNRAAQAKITIARTACMAAMASVYRDRLVVALSSHTSVDYRNLALPERRLLRGRIEDCHLTGILVGDKPHTRCLQSIGHRGLTAKTAQKPGHAKTGSAKTGSDRSRPGGKRRNWTIADRSS